MPPERYFLQLPNFDLTDNKKFMPRSNKWVCHLREYCCSLIWWINGQCWQLTLSEYFRGVIFDCLVVHYFKSDESITNKKAVFQWEVKIYLLLVFQSVGTLAFATPTQDVSLIQVVLLCALGISNAWKGMKSSKTWGFYNILPPWLRM